MEQDSLLKVSLAKKPVIKLANKVSVKAPNCHFRRKPKEYIWYFVVEGVMVINEGDKTYQLERGDSLILSPGKTHWGSPTNSIVNYLYIHFTWEDIQEENMAHPEYLKYHVESRMKALQGKKNHIPEDAMYIPKYCHIEDDNFMRINEDAEKIISVWNEGMEYCAYRCSNSFMNLLFDMCCGITDIYVKGTAPKNHTVLEVMLYLRNHYMEKIKSSDIEEYMHLNFNYLNRKFKENTGKTIFQYLLEYRIGCSKSMLKSGMYTNSKIAEKIGFCNEFYFARVFKKETGSTPSEYRKGGFSHVGGNRISS